MKDFIIKNEREDSLKVVRLFSQSVQSLIVDYEDMTARLEQSELRIKELEQENERLQSEQLSTTCGRQHLGRRVVKAEENYTAHKPYI